MKNMNFVFKSGEEVVIDAIGKYDKDSNKFFLDTGEESFEVNVGDIFSFIRTTHDGKFCIQNRGNITKVTVSINELAKTYEIKALKFSRHRESDREIIIYELESDPGCIKTIILSWDSLSS